MNLFSEMIQAVYSDLNAGQESTLYPLTTVKMALNRSYMKCGGLFRWPETEDAKQTSTQNGIDYYDYPENWRPDSMWKIMVDGVNYGDPIAFKDFQKEIEDGIPSGREHLWTSQWRRFFLYPVPTTNGDFNITVHGQRVVEMMEEDADVTIFSYSMPECNEAVILEAVAILKNKEENEKAGEFRSSEAKGILAIAWGKIRQDQAKYQRVQPQYDVPDFFGKGSTSDIIGKF
jgi:hypothetical protein